MVRNRKILISGASIAGPALAYWLHRHGFEPTVVERAPDIRAGGYKIDLRGAAVDVAERMGILTSLREAETDMRTMSFVNSANRTLATVPADLFLGNDEADVEVMREDLSRMLYDATRREVPYVFGDSVVALAQHDQSVTVSFEHRDAEDFDLVIGADGLHSAVRAAAFGEESDFLAHLGYGVSIFSVPNHLGLDRSEVIYAVPGRTTNVYSTRQDAGAKALLLWASPDLSYDRADVAGQLRIVNEVFAGAGWEVDRLLAAAPDAPDFYFDLVSQVRMEHWSRGRVALVGDAAYGPSLASGQGTSLAMVGAYVLAGELAAAGGDHILAFQRYEQGLREFVARNLKLGQDNVKRMVARSRFQTWMGVALMRVLPRLPGRRAMVNKLTRPVHEAATAITLRDYPTDPAELT